MNRILNWYDRDVIYVSPETLNRKIAELKLLEEKGEMVRVDWYNARSLLRVYKTYCIKTTKNSSIVRIVNSFDQIEQYCFNAHIGTANDSKEISMSGQKAWNFIDGLFIEEYGDSAVSLFKAFSGNAYKEQFIKIKNCVPKPISMINQLVIGRKVDHVYKADVSSAYPSEGSKIIPTLHKSITVKGIQKPTKDYPFCFYVKSHHMAILNELDTHTWAKRKKFYTLYDEMFDDTIGEENEETIMCKASEYSLKCVFEKVYQKKMNGDKTAKLGMNAAIGMMQKDSNPRLSHIAAVIIARCCERIMMSCYNLMKEGNIILFIATDSVIWKGKPSSEATEKKYMGSFTYEVHDSCFYGTGSKAYQIIDDCGNVITKYSGMKNGEEKDNLKFGDIPFLKGGPKKYTIHSDTGIVEELFNG